MPSPFRASGLDSEAVWAGWDGAWVSLSLKARRWSGASRHCGGERGEGDVVSCLHGCVHDMRMRMRTCIHATLCVHVCTTYIPRCCREELELVQVG